MSLDQDAVDVMSTGEYSCLGNSRSHGQAKRMFNHCTVTALDLGYCVDLFLDALTAVDNAESTLKRHGLGHSKTGDTVHIGRNNG